MLYLTEFLRNEYGGTVYRLTFIVPPTFDELDEAVKKIDVCPFGYRTLNTNSDGDVITIKIHNDWGENFMPIYEYQCTNGECKNMFEKLVGSINKICTKCPKCGYLSKRIMSVSHFRFGDKHEYYKY